MIKNYELNIQILNFNINYITLALNRASHSHKQTGNSNWGKAAPYYYVHTKGMYKRYTYIHTCEMTI